MCNNPFWASFNNIFLFHGGGRCKDDSHESVAEAGFDGGSLLVKGSFGDEIVQKYGCS